MLDSKRSQLLKISGLCGLVNPVIVLTLIILAISMSPWFDWNINALSHLGMEEGVVGIIFNLSLILGGILLFIFSMGLMFIFAGDLEEKLSHRVLGLIGTIILMLDAVALSTIGIYPGSIQPIHNDASITFFSFLPISLIVIGIAMIRVPSQRKIGFFTILAGIFAALVWAVPWQGYAIPEMLASISASVWSFILGIDLFIRGRL